MEPREALIAARALISDSEHWCQDVHAEANTGMEVCLDDEEAYSFCADGALSKVCGVRIIDGTGDWIQNSAYQSAFRELNESAFVLFNCGIVETNDYWRDEQREKSHKRVLACFDRAIANL